MLELMLHPVNAREKPQGGGVWFWASLNTESKKKTLPDFFIRLNGLVNRTIRAITQWL